LTYIIFKITLGEIFLGIGHFIFDYSDDMKGGSSGMKIRARIGKMDMMAGFVVALIFFCSVAQAQEKESIPESRLAMEGGSAMRSITEGVAERIRTSMTGKTWHEQPDHVLYRLSEQKWNRLFRDGLGLPNWVELSGQQRTRFESISHPWRKGSLGQTDVQVPMRSNVRLGVTEGRLSVLFEGVDSRTNYQNNSNDFNGSSLINQADILQLFAAVKLENTFGTGLRTDIHFGRLTFEFGSTRLIGRNVFPNVTNAFDGAHVNLARPKEWRVRAFLVEPRLWDPVQLDEQSNKQLFWGTMGEYTKNPWLITEPYYLGLNDTVSATRRLINTYGLRIHRRAGNPDLFYRLHTQYAANGNDNGIRHYLNGVEGFDYEFELAFQEGKRAQTDFFAYMGHAEIGYTFNLPWYPRVVAQYDYASGTRTPGGSQNSTFDRLFGLRRFDMMPTGNFGPFFRSNISSPGWRIVANPTKGMQVFLKQRFWYLAQGTDAFVGSNQPGFSAIRDPTGNSGNYLGHDLELAWLWHVGTGNNLTLEAGWDHWFKGTYFDRLPASAGLPPGGNKDSDYFYISMQIRL